MNQVFKIVITGGPCAGKTTGLATLTQVLQELGYVVLSGPESASEVQLSGFKPYGNISIPNDVFQEELLHYQLYKENMYDRMVAHFPKDQKYVMLLDRGTLDGKAYCSAEAFSAMLENLGFTETELLERYQMVIHMTSAAIGAEEFYTLENNEARRESLEEARQADQRTMACYLGHPNFHIIANEGNFEHKINQVVQVLLQELKYPVPIKQQRKFIVAPSIVNQLDRFPSYRAVTIEQFYTEEEREHCFRKVFDGKLHYYYEIFKEDIKGVSIRTKTSTRITEKSYYQNLYQTTIAPICKQRYSFIYQNQHFRLDIFEDGLCILEIEATLENQKIVVPPFLEVIEDVSENIQYQNRALFQAKDSRKQKVFSLKNV